jgi:3-oxoacyl-[acyl-carrier protein] reductase
VLINSAAVKPASAVALLTPQASAAQAMSVNVLGTFLLCREGAKLMMRRRWGRIVNLGSMAVRHEFVGESIYTATKAAVCSFSRVLAKELYPHGITCNVVAPSVVPTEMVSAIQAGALREMLARNAVPEPGRFEDISATIDWLIRPESQAVTAQIIYLGGA